MDYYRDPNQQIQRAGRKPARPRRRYYYREIPDLHHLPTHRSLYSWLLPLMFIALLAIGTIGGVRFFQTYAVKIEPRKQTVKQVKFARTPILSFGTKKYALLAISYHPDARRRAVIMRDITSNALQSVRVGQRAFRDGPLVEKISSSNLLLRQGNQSVIISLPEVQSLASRARNLL